MISSYNIFCTAILAPCLMSNEVIPGIICIVARSMEASKHNLYKMRPHGGIHPSVTSDRKDKRDFKVRTRQIAHKEICNWEAASGHR